MDANYHVTCDHCGSRYRLDYAFVFPQADSAVYCPNCSAILHTYHEPRIYFVKETIEVRNDHEARQAPPSVRG